MSDFDRAKLIMNSIYGRGLVLQGEELLNFFDSIGSGWIREVLNERSKMTTRKPATTSVTPTTDVAPRVEVTRIGNLVKDPELRYTTKGQALCETDLAVNPRPGEEKETEFYRLLIFGPLGENVAESNLEKSTRVIVVGSPDIETVMDAETGQAAVDENGNVKIRKKIFVNAIGPDLRFAKVDGLTKIHRSAAKPAVELDNF